MRAEWMVVKEIKKKKAVYVAIGHLIVKTYETKNEAVQAIRESGYAGEIRLL